MSILKGCSFLLLLAPLTSFGFNLSPETAYVLPDPTAPYQSYFGYTVALQTNPSRVVVGAPRSASNLPSYENISEPGAVYTCRLDIRYPCSPILLERSGERRVSEEKIFDLKSNAFIGAALDVSDVSSSMVVCGPLWKNQHFANEYLVNGVCYGVQNTSKLSNVEAQKLLPLIKKSEQTFTPPGRKDPHFHHAFGEAGFSTHLTHSHELLIGAPGVLLWTGTVIKYEYNAVTGLFMSPPRVPNPFYSFNLGILEGAYAGYAVSSGLLMRDTLLYVMSAPRSAAYRGQVYIFEFPAHDQAPWDVRANLSGTRMGEYFGASLAITDVDGDGLEDLLVGAPLYSSDVKGDGDTGCVYVYRNPQIWDRTSSPTLLTGRTVPGARFGTAVGALADLDLDGFKDIAIGAPYEESGVVYIYRGSSAGLAATYTQRITPVDPTIRTFGFSISRALDIDGNHYPDIAVGAYESGHAVVVKSRPVVKLNAHLKRSITRLNANSTKELLLEVCLVFQGQFLPQILDVNALLVLDEIHHRTRQTTNWLPFKLKWGVPSCKIQGVTLKPVETWPAFSEFSALPITLNCTLAHQCPTCPLPSPDSSLGDFHKIQVMNTCDKDECVAEWQITLSFVHLRDPLILGSTKTAILRVIVENIGDSAHIMKLVIALPGDVHLKAVPALCLPSGSASTNWTCLSAIRIDQNQKKSFDLPLDLSKLNSSLIQVNATAYSFDSSIVSTVQALLHVIRKSVAGIRSLARPEIAVVSPTSPGLPSNTPSPATPASIPITHNFEVFCAGYTPLDRVRILLVVPSEMRIRGIWEPILTNPIFQGSLGDEPVECRLVERKRRELSGEVSLSCGHPPGSSELDVECVMAVCQAGPLLPSFHNLYISVKFDLNIHLAGVIVGENHQLVVNTSATVEVDGEVLVVGSASSRIAGPVAPKPLPFLPLYIALAVAAALLLLTLFTVGLWKCGFFNRWHEPTGEEAQLGDGEPNLETPVVNEIP